MDESTWEPENNLFTIQDLIEEYNAEKKLSKVPKRKAGRKGRKRRRFIRRKGIKNVDELNNINNSDNNNNNSSENNNNNKIVNFLDNVKPYFMLDNSIDEILGVKLEKNELVGIVKKRDKNGKVYTEKMSTEDIKKTNPWILVDFYESKIVCQ